MFMKLFAARERYGTSLIESKFHKGAFPMRSFIMALSAASLVIPASMAVPVAGAQAKRHYTPRVYTRNGHTYCRHSDGTTGLIAGGVGGAVVGNAIIGHGALGAIVGGVGGALGGRAIDRSMTAKKRCR